MHSLFDLTTYTETIQRINQLTPGSAAGWGKMNVSQMLAHCKEAFRVPLTDRKLPRLFIGRLLGWAIRSKLYNDTPWAKNLPTSPAFRITDEREFHKEKQELLELVNKFYAAGPTGAGKFPHPMFGKFTPEQWGKGMYKHLDHHLKQFGV
ncbi:MAG TPA: DUF1569 domain-containing protein [Ferruginibacter sp.]|nr:DUF1569 domain-containing protein [Ferruginibacter sp.]